MAVVAQSIADFQTWRPGYAAAIVEVREPNSTKLKKLWYDQAQTESAGNPQTLESYTDSDGQRYGKFSRPIYAAGSYELLINGSDQTGVVRAAITSLQDEIVSYAMSATQRSMRQRRLIDRFNDAIQALDFGELGGSAATNTTTLTAAIGAASGQGGGAVLLPPGAFPITTLTLPQNVRLVGHSRAATTLQSQEAEAVVTLSGDRAGLCHMTLDGINLQTGSIGVYSKANTSILFDDVLLKRFDVGLQCVGGDRALWYDLSIDNCDTAADLAGDSDPGGGGDGDAYEFNTWRGGQITDCSSYGIRLRFADQLVRNNVFTDLGIESNVAAIAFDLVGARKTELRNCYWSANGTNLNVNDGTDTNESTLNTVIGLLVAGGYFNDGDNDLDDTCQDVVFERVDFAGVTWNMSLPDNQILLQDCTEDLNVTVAGDTSKLLRQRRILDGGGISGVTTDANATTVWAYTLEPGQIAIVEAKVCANQRDGTNYAVYHIEAGVRRPGAQLTYDAQTANFTVGATLTGQTSGATARVVADSDSGTTGTLTLRDIVGTFDDNEIITDSNGTPGSATVNGVVSYQNTALDSGGVSSLRTAVESDASLACTLAVSGGDVQLQVTGLAGHIFEWTAEIKVST